jgi:hypothetical protein
MLIQSFIILFIIAILWEMGLHPDFATLGNFPGGAEAGGFLLGSPGRVDLGTGLLFTFGAVVVSGA